MVTLPRTAVRAPLLAALVVLLFRSALFAQYPVVQNPTEMTVINATTVFSQAMQMPQNEIPRQLLSNAQAIAIVPDMMKGAFVFGAQFGRGVLIIRDPNGAWQAPRMITIAGGSFGYQIGVQATDLILVFRTPQSVQNLLRGTLKVGVDASAAIGPLGRQTSASTDFRTAAEILSYSRARGAFVGASIDGSSISMDPGAEAIYYQPPGSFPASAAQLLQVINAYTAAQPVVAPPVLQPAGQPAVLPSLPPVTTTGQIMPAPGTSWMPAGQHPTDLAAQQQLNASYQQMAASLDDRWRPYLAPPADLYTNPQASQQMLQKYEAVARDPQYGSLTSRSDFQQTLTAVRRVSDVRTASNVLPPPPIQR